jgi:hypothetical protein
MPFTRSFKQAYSNGMRVEEMVKPIIEAKWGPVKKLAANHSFDFEGDTFFVEVKGRTNTHLQYPTTLLPEAKILAAKQQTKKLYCVFAFSDTIQFIEYSQDVFDKFHIEDKFVCRQRADINDKPRPHYHIPVGVLSYLGSPPVAESDAGPSVCDASCRLAPQSLAH